MNAAATATAPTAQITEGIYWNKVGVFLVERSKTSGNLYAKIRKGTHWEYAKGAIYKLQPQTKVTLEIAKAYGIATGNCMICGRQLTNPESVSFGIGPICRGKF